MKPIHLLIGLGIGFLLLKRKGEPVKLPPVRVYAPVEKPIPFPTSFQYEQMPERPTSSNMMLDAVISPQTRCEQRGGIYTRSGCQMPKITTSNVFNMLRNRQQGQI